METVFGSIPRRTLQKPHEYASTSSAAVIRVAVNQRPLMGNQSSRDKEPAKDNVVLSIDKQNRVVPHIIVTTPTPVDEQRSFHFSPSQPAPPQNTPNSRTPEIQRRYNVPSWRAKPENSKPETPPPDHPPPPPPSETAQFNAQQIIDRLQQIPTIQPKPRTILPVIRPLAFSKKKINKFDTVSQDSYGSFRSRSSTVSTKQTHDSYPIYNPIEDYTFASGKTFQKSSFPIDTNRVNIGFCGRKGAGKSCLINALRGLNDGDANSAGRYVCDSMEPFRFMQDEYQSIVLWEIPYPRSFTTIVDVYDLNMGFDRYYESLKLGVFTHLFVLLPDGTLHDDDLAFSRVVQANRTPLTLLSTKTDEDLNAESRETGQGVGESLKNSFQNKARRIFVQHLQKKAQILISVPLLFISSPVIRNLVSGTIGYLPYELDEKELLNIVKLPLNCHLALETKFKKPEIAVARPSKLEVTKPTVLADAGFEIFYGTDDRVFGTLEPKTTVVRAGKTTFNYGFIGAKRVGKSAMINAMRGMSSKHPFAAGNEKASYGSCQKYEFDDDLLKYSVSLWELHYPKKVNLFFEFIDAHNLANFTALFVLIDTAPNDVDLTFAKIAHRRHTTVVFLSSKTDKKLSTKSRADEIPVCDLLKQRYVDRGMERFDNALASSAPELCGRVQCFFVSAPVFRSLRLNDQKYMHFLVHEKAVFDFLKQKRIIAEMLESPAPNKDLCSKDTGTAGIVIESENEKYEDAKS